MTLNETVKPLLVRLAVNSRNFLLAFSWRTPAFSAVEDRLLNLDQYFGNREGLGKLLLNRFTWVNMGQHTGRQAQMMPVPQWTVVHSWVREKEGCLPPGM